jgi:transcription elongation factor Elf1
MAESKIPFTCPVCGRKTDRPIAELVEGAVLSCPFCKLTLKLHGHMLEEVKREIQKLEEKD